MKIRILAAAAMAILLCWSCGGGVMADRTVILENAVPVPGQHCESSAMVNMLNYEGYGLSEEQVVGGGAVLGFVFDDGKFPFLGGRTLDMKENLFSALNIAYHEVAKDTAKDWDGILSILEQGHPVVLRVDMRYLTYLFGGKYGSKYMSFGWHMITLFGIDAETQTAYVTDTDRPGLQTIKLKDLWKARFSKLKVMPPEGLYYWVEKAPADFGPDWEQVALQAAAKAAAAMTGAENQDGLLIGLAGMEEFPGRITNLQDQVPSYLMGPALDFIYGSIQTNGTGGSAFRKLFYDFLDQTAVASGNSDLRGAADALAPAVDTWKELADLFRALAKDKKVLKDKQALSSALKFAADRAARLAVEEKRFYNFVNAQIALTVKEQ